MRERLTRQKRLRSAAAALLLAYVVYFLILINAARDYANVAWLLVLFIAAVSCITTAYVGITGTRPDWLEKALQDLRH